jgi:hypothetical protein
MSIPSKPDASSDGKQPEWDDYAKNGDKDDSSKLAKSDDRFDDGACGKDDTSHNPGEALARFDFSRGDFGSHGADHSGDILGALASMSSDDALEYAIGQMGPADHFDLGHLDVADTSHDTDA